MRTLSFVIPGKPIQQGSMRAFTRRGGRVGMTHSNEKDLRGFRELVAARAFDAGARSVDGPVNLIVTFVMPRPKGHFGSGRNAGILKASAPHFHTTKPDLDKLVRSLLDGLTHVAFTDDSQVVALTVRKVYATPNRGVETMDFPTPCTEVAIAYLGEREEAAVG